MAKNGGKPMNGNNSTTETPVSERLSDSKRLSMQWKTIDWKKAEQEVNRLQVRIVKATQEKKWNTVKRLQYLLTHSFYAKALAVRRVTTNKGKKTAGVDGEIWSTPAMKMRAVLLLTDKGYKAKPLRRVYIEKKDKKKKRPLGIPTMYDRAMQALYALALEPVAEGDIKGCFDNISHEWLIENIPMDKSILKQFVKAGFIFKGELFPTEDGTPQGGVISPILANMALDGMQEVLINRFDLSAKGKVSAFVHNKSKVNLVRYADDFIVTAATKEIAEEAKGLIREFLKTRGLELSEEKTVITHINDGFDMLGWTFRKFKGKLIVKPSKKSIQAIVRNLSDTILKRGKAWNQDVLIMKLNQQIRGWTNYHQSVCAAEAFAHLDYILYELLWRWAKRRHPKKGQWWISTKYWHQRGNRNWVFSTDTKELIRVDHTPIVRHTKVREAVNPFLDTEYFKQRKFNQGMKKLSGRFKLIWKNQDGCCYHCGMPLDISDEREIFFKVPKSCGGKEEVANMAYVHADCQRIYLESRSKE